mmetsp:Transcript_21877/g.47728  ORF Transcript_21877/g.47728 Transcript_21877/m.47728 type:complete len:86 (-) Transcript_21877:598-855(-)
MDESAESADLVEVSGGLVPAEEECSPDPPVLQQAVRSDLGGAVYSEEEDRRPAENGCRFRAGPVAGGPLSKAAFRAAESELSETM